MKTNLLFFPLILLFLGVISSCSPSNRKHDELISWLDNKEHYLGTDAKDFTNWDDGEIIRILEKVSEINKYLYDSLQLKSEGNSALSVLEDALVFQQFLDTLKQSKFFDTEPILFQDAQRYHHNYTEARTLASRLENIPNEIGMDDTEATVFTLPEIIIALNATHNPTMFTWYKPSWWEGKGFLIYPANYGAEGRNSNHDDAFKSTTIFQPAFFVRTDPIDDKDIWTVFKDHLYNFGDLKPPKIKLSNPEDGPR